MGDDSALAEKIAKSCSCKESCVFSGLTELSKSFKMMRESERVSVLRSMMLALTSYPGEPNNFTKPQAQVTK